MTSAAIDPSQEAKYNARWPLAQRLSNPSLNNGVFSVDERDTEGVITYHLNLDDFLGIENKVAVEGKGFLSSGVVRKVQLADEDPFMLHFEACSQSDEEDWTPATCNLRRYLRIRSQGLLFGGDAVPSLLVKSSSGTETHELSTEIVQQFIESRANPDEWEDEDDGASTPAPGGMVANGLFGAGMKFGRLVSYFKDGPPHPGKLKTRKDANGHIYFGCEKHAHSKPGSGDRRGWRTVCNGTDKCDQA